MLTMLALIFLGSMLLIIATIVDSMYMRRNQTWTIFKNQAWPVLRIGLSSAALVSFVLALCMAFER